MTTATGRDAGAGGPRLAVGCPQWTHASWFGRFIPKGTPSAERLRAYASWCDAVEGNTTFYATPSPATVAGWAGQAPPDFRFVPKFPGTVTHEGRLGAAPGGVDGAVREFLAAVEPLDGRAHALWLQLPGAFGPGDVGTLVRFLRRLPPRHRYAVEVRHPAFFSNPGSADLLERGLATIGAEWVPFDTVVLFDSPPATEKEREGWSRKPRLPRRTRALTDAPIVRFIGRDDPDRTVAGWAPWVRVMAEWLRESRSPTFFLHTPGLADAPELARRFHAAVRAEVPSLAPLPEPEPEPAEPPTLF